jgi:two-component system, NarL family, invasion response regulator UvrY
MSAFDPKRTLPRRCSLLKVPGILWQSIHYRRAHVVPEFVVGWDVRSECENVTSVLVIDDHPIVLQGCRRLLADAGVTSVLEASDVAAGYEIFCRHRPDAVIVDLAIGENRLEGLALIQRIKSHDPQAHILVLSMHRDPIIVARALEAGANGYILKETATDDLLTAIQTIQEGKSYLSQDLALQVAH